MKSKIYIKIGLAYVARVEDQNWYGRVEKILTFTFEEAGVAVTFLAMRWWYAASNKELKQIKSLPRRLTFREEAEDDILLDPALLFSRIIDIETKTKSEKIKSTKQYFILHPETTKGHLLYQNFF